MSWAVQQWTNRSIPKLHAAAAAAPIQSCFVLLGVLGHEARLIFLFHVGRSSHLCVCPSQHVFTPFSPARVSWHAEENKSYFMHARSLPPIQYNAMQKEDTVNYD